MEFEWDFGNGIGIWNWNQDLELLEFERKFGVGFRRGIFGLFGSGFLGWIDLDRDFWMDLNGSGFLDGFEWIGILWIFMDCWILYGWIEFSWVDGWIFTILDGFFTILNN